MSQQLPTPQHAPLFATTRGYAGNSTTECVQYGSIAVVDRDGHILASVGDPLALHFSRSTLKPVQALPFLEDGGMARFGFGSHELAMMCASHSGEAMHVAVVNRMLKRIGVASQALQCGTQIPQYFDATHQAVPSKVQPTSLTHNCSGKHSGFLAYCQLHGHPLTSYLDPNSPLQVRIRNTVQALSPKSRLAIGRDGCNAPNVALALTDLAHIYAQLAASDDGTPLGDLRHAMLRHPDLISGTQRTDLSLMTMGKNDWICKIGADGLQAIGVRSLGVGIVVRAASGSIRATLLATIEVLHQLGLLEHPETSALAYAYRPAIVNASGQVVGQHLPLFRLPRLVA